MCVKINNGACQKNIVTVLVYGSYLCISFETKTAQSSIALISAYINEHVIIDEVIILQGQVSAQLYGWNSYICGRDFVSYPYYIFLTVCADWRDIAFYGSFSFMCINPEMSDFSIKQEG